MSQPMNQAQLSSLAEAIGRIVLHVAPPAAGVCTIVILPDGAFMLGGPLPGSDERRVRAQLAHVLRQLLSDLESQWGPKPGALVFPGGRA